MKNLKTILIVLFITIGCKSFSQDIIIKNDKTELKVKVLELTDDVIKYRKFEMLDGPIYSIKKPDVFMIIYKNGTKEYIENKQKEVENIPINPTSSGYSLPPNVIEKKPEIKPKNEVQKSKGKFYSGIAFDDKFNAYEVNFLFRIKGDFLIGLSGSQTFDVPKITSFYGNLTYKNEVAKDFNLWGSVGYKYFVIEGYTYLGVFPYSYEVPSTSGSDITWQIGSDYFIVPDSFGITVYSYELKSFFFGLIYKW